MTQEIGAREWALDVPNDWIITPDKECIKVEPEGGNAALQISAAYARDGEVLDHDLQEFADDYLEDRVTLSPCNVGDLTGKTATYEEGARMWSTWFLHKSRVMLLITFVCTAPEYGGLAPTIGHILSTLRLRAWQPSRQRPSSSGKSKHTRRGRMPRM